MLKSNTKNKIFAIAGGLLVLLILAFALPTFATQIYGTYPSGGGGFSPPPCGNGVCASDETCSTCPTDCGACPPPAPVISNIFTDTTYNSAIIHWTTDINADSEVAYGVTTAYGATSTVSESVTNHAVPLAGLLPSTLYHFRAASTASGQTAYSADQTFTTGVAPDTAPPIISNLAASDLAPTSATVSFQTNEVATSTLVYTSSYESTELKIQTFVANHIYSLSGLIPNTTYNVSATAGDASYNQSAPSVLTFKTAKDAIPPPNVNDFAAAPGDGKNMLSWTNQLVSDFVGVKILKKIGAYPSSPSDGVVVYTGSDQTIVDAPLTNGTTYYYTAFAFDTSENYSSGAVASGKPEAPVPPPSCGDTVCGLGESCISCPTDCGACPPLPPACSNGVCSQDETCSTCPTDCGACPALPQGAVACDEGTFRCTGTTREICQNADWVPYEQNSPICGYLAPPISVPAGSASVAPEQKLALADFEFFSADRALRLALKDDGVNVLAEKILTIFLDPKLLSQPPREMGVAVGASTYLLNLDKLTEKYAADFAVSSAPGNFSGTITIIYENNTFDELTFNLRVLPSGKITCADGSPIDGATVSVFELKDGAWQLWNGAQYNQKNPTFASADGEIGFIAPIGTYYLSAGHEGFLKYETNRFSVDNNVINQIIKLTAVPPSLKEVIKKDAPLVENIQNVTKNIAEKIVFGSEVAQKTVTDFVQNPVVEQTAQNIAAPTLVGVAVANTVAAAPIFNIGNYFQYLVTQPLLLFIRKRRKGWGIVYNALTKLPVDLAIVRLLDAATGGVVQTRVTDKQGRFIFIAPIGNYLIDVIKRGFEYPSVFLKTKREDESYADLYHKEIINVKEAGAALTPNIPIDPLETRVSRAQLILKQIFSGVQRGLSLGGLAAMLLALIIIPSTAVAIFAATHILLYLLFRRLATTPPPKSWGIVYDEKSKTPLRFVIARIFEAQYNKLLATQITDLNGRYSFLVGKNIYYLTFEKAGYAKAQTPTIDLRKKEKGEVIALDIPLKSATENQPTLPEEIKFEDTEIK